MIERFFLLQQLAKVLVHFSEQLAYRRAAPGTKSAVTAAFLATVFVGDMFGGLFSQLYGRVSPGVYFLLQALIAAGAALIFARVAAGGERRQAS